MITRPAIQQVLFGDPIPPTWTGSDDWETPGWLAKAMAGLAHGRTLEMAAGTGQIAQFLPGSTCIEINPARVAVGRSRAPECDWVCGSALDPFVQGQVGRFDTIITNPPFSLGVDFIKATAALLIPGGVAYFLLPSTFLQTKGCGGAFRRLAATHQLHLVGKTELVGRPAYLMDGVEVSGRKCDDAIFAIAYQPDPAFRFEFGFLFNE